MLALGTRLVRQLITDATSATHRSLQTKGPRGRVPDNEVTAVEALVVSGFADVATRWENRLVPLGYGIAITSIFTHSRPQVTFTSSQGSDRCELADLLVVVDACNPDGSVWDRRAVLTQAKLLKAGQLKLAKKEEKQFDLLSEWPPFSFVETNRYDNRPRDFQAANCPDDPHLSGEYGGIDLRPGIRSWRQLLLDMPYQFVSPVTLGDYIARMLIGAPACGRQAIAGGKDDWSSTVDELIIVTGALLITKTLGVSRGHQHQIGFVTGASLLHDHSDAIGGGGSSGPDERGGEGAWRDGAISVVRFAVTMPEWPTSAAAIDLPGGERGR